MSYSPRTPSITLIGRNGHHPVRRSAVRLVARYATACEFVKRYPKPLTKPAERRARQLFKLVKAALEPHEAAASRRRGKRVPEDSNLRAA